MLSILPDNDFLDDAPSSSALGEGAPYRPLLVGRYPNYEVRYPPGGPSQSLSWKNTATAVLDEYSLLFRSRQQVGGLLKGRFDEDMRSGPNDGAQTKGTKIHSFYFDYSAEQFARLRYAIEQIKAIAGARPMLIFTIPRPPDYQRASIAGTPPLTRELTALASNLGVTYIDLLEATKDADWRKFFLSCDGHWSNDGHQEAAKHLAMWRAAYPNSAKAAQ